VRRPRTIHLVLALGLGAMARAMAQEPPRADLERLAGIRAAVVRVASANADAIWPGFRPDTIPVLYVLPDRGTLLLGWPAADLPGGFGPVPGMRGVGWQPVASRAAASTNTSLAGRNAAQVFVFGDASDADLYGTTVHECFHVFERSVAREGRRFGAGENTFLLTSYPVFDPVNEAGVALEGRLLTRALRERTVPELRQRAQAFVAAREARHRALGADLAGFETQGELNEGLAEYTLIRALELAAPDNALPWHAGAAREREDRLARLDSLTSNVRQSIRFRFYVTGPAMGLLLDRLRGPDWRRHLAERDLTLQDAVAEASGYRDRERALLARAARDEDTAALARVARTTIRELRALRRAQVDSVLARPGLTVVLRADSVGGGFGLCGMDPQNMLQVDVAVLLHTHFVRPCASGLSGMFTTGVVQDQAAGTFSAVVGPEDSVRVTSGGSRIALRDGETLVATDLKLEAPGATLQVARAALARRGRTLEIVPLRR
jgi:hypothetical protein